MKKYQKKKTSFCSSDNLSDKNLRLLLIRNMQLIQRLFKKLVWTLRKNRPKWGYKNFYHITINYSCIIAMADSHDTPPSFSLSFLSCALVAHGVFFVFLFVLYLFSLLTHSFQWVRNIDMGWDRRNEYYWGRIVRWSFDYGSMIIVYIYYLSSASWHIFFFFFLSWFSCSILS